MSELHRRSPTQMDGINDQMRGLVSACAVAGQTIEDVYGEINEVESVELNTPCKEIVLSPRSAKACIQTGVNPNYLMMRDFDSFKDDTCDSDMQKMRHEAYEYRRQEHIRLVRTARKKIIKSKVQCFPDKLVLSASKRSSKDETSTMIQEERKRIKRMQERHQAEIENVLSFEIKTQNIQNKAAVDLALQKEREQRQQEEMMRRARQRNEGRRHRAEKAREQEAAEDKAKKALAYQMYLEEREQAEEVKANEKIANLEARIREDERKQKAKEYKEATEAILQEQQNRVSERMERMEQAEHERKKQQQRARKLYRKKLAIKRQLVKERIAKSSEQARHIQEKLRSDYHAKQEVVEQRRWQLEQTAEMERELAAKHQQLLECKRQMVLAEARQEEEDRKQRLLQQQKDQEEALKRIQDQNEIQREKRKLRKQLNHQLRADTVQRWTRVKDHACMESLIRLADTRSRVENMEAQKRALLEERKQASIKMTKWHEQVNEVMERVKITKKWKDAGKLLKTMRLSDGDGDGDGDASAKPRRRNPNPNQKSRRQSQSQSSLTMSLSLPTGTAQQGYFSRAASTSTSTSTSASVSGSASGSGSQGQPPLQFSLELSSSLMATLSQASRFNATDIGNMDVEALDQQLALAAHFSPLGGRQTLIASANKSKAAVASKAKRKKSFATTVALISPYTKPVTPNRRSLLPNTRPSPISRTPETKKGFQKIKSVHLQNKQTQNDTKTPSV